MVLSELVLLLAGSDDHALAHGEDGANGKDPQRYLDSMRNAKALKANAAQAQDKPLRALDEAADHLESGRLSPSLDIGNDLGTYQGDKASDDRNCLLYTSDAADDAPRV